MPAHTESRILELVTKALAATSDDEVDRVLPQLRAALREHIRLAKESLESSIVVLPRERTD